MAKIRIQNLVLGMVQTNVYFLQNPDTNEMILIDPADRPDALIEKADALHGEMKAILQTHGHFDHIGATEEVRRHFHVPVYADRDEQRVLEDPELNLSALTGAKPAVVRADLYLHDGQEITLAGYRIVMLHTPGHTCGSCCYYLPDEHVLFSGDTLFRYSCGRTDLPTGSGADMQRSLTRLMTELPPDTAVYPGHDAFTTIADERRNNPYAPES